MKETFELPGNTTLTFNSGNHQYRVSVNGQKPVHCPSVTTILNVLAKPALVEWGVRMACDYVDSNLRTLVTGDSFSVQQVLKIVEQARTAHDRARDEAAEIGTNVHDWLRDWWREEVTVLPEEGRAKNCVQAALNWFDEHDLKPVSIEEPLYSKEFHICGRPDWVGYVDGQLCILDYKSTRQIYPELCLQCTAYGQMHYEMTGKKPATRWGLRLDKESGQFEARCYKPETFDDDWNSFLACLKIYEKFKHLRRKEKPEPKIDILAEL